jgi:hypothetical protein
MECVERKPLVRPIGEQLDELAATDEILCPERENLRHSVTGRAGAQHRADVVHRQAAGNRDPQFLPAAVKFRANSRIDLFRASLAEKRVVIATFDCEKEHLNRVIIA